MMGNKSGRVSYEDIVNMNKITKGLYLGGFLGKEGSAGGYGMILPLSYLACGCVSVPALLYEVLES